MISSIPQEPAPILPSMAASAYGIAKPTSKGTNTSASLGHINFHEAIKFIEKNGLQAVDVVTVGACMFKAVSLCASGNEEGCQELRVATVKYISDYAAELNLFITYYLLHILFSNLLLIKHSSNLCYLSNMPLNNFIITYYTYSIII